MSTEENPSGKTTEGSPSVVIETASVKTGHKYRQPVQSTAEASSTCQKSVSSTAKISSERHKHVSKKSSTRTQSNTRDPIPTGIEMTSMDKTGSKMEEIVLMTAPTSTKPMLGRPASPIPGSIKTMDEPKDETDSITSEITELRTPETAKKGPEWSDDEEAGGLPRNESRASRTSRVSYAVRQFFCCGMQIEAPSEDNVSSPRDDFFHSAI